MVIASFLMPMLDLALAPEHLLRGFVAASFLSGWIITVLDMPIYMAWEGRRFWPRRLWNRGVRREEGRLDRVYAVIEGWRAPPKGMRPPELLEKPESNSPLHSEYIRRERAAAEASIEWRTFPIPETSSDVDWTAMQMRGSREAQLPTRLGNLLLSIEQYPWLIYGMDGIFYWNRLWLKMDDSARGQIDDVQAMADSTLYVATALLMGALLCVAYAASAPFSLALDWPVAVTWYWWLAIAGVSVLLAVAFYRGGLFLHKTYGELYKALFDTWAADIDLGAARAALAERRGLDRDAIDKMPLTNRNSGLWRFLHNYRIKPKLEDW